MTEKLHNWSYPIRLVQIEEHGPILAQCSRIVEQAASAAECSTDIFQLLAHYRRVLGAVYTLTAAGFPAAAIAAKAASPRFDELLVKKLLARALVIELLHPFFKAT